MTTCQKCIRTGDIENVGKTARHLTFFEMLGNFSFGDYFKHEAIHWSWEFLTQVLGLEEDRLYPSIYGEDDEAFEIWNKEVGVPAEKITRFYRDPETGECDNFWEHGAGPCGPCSEIYYDRGEKYGCGRPDCKVGCDCDRFMEVWNNVFTQFEGDGKGGYTELAQKNIDTGMGLERLAVVMQDVDSVFDIDTMKAIRDKVCEMSGKKYQVDALDDVSIRLITDHIRSATFMISDGIMPSNEGRGYVLRRIIRRAARHGRMLGIGGTFMAKLAATVIDESKDGYPELEEKKDFIFKVLTQEEEKFAKTIDQGLAILEKMEKEMQTAGEKTLSGENAFKLYDTYGFPLDLTQEILEEKGFSIDEDGFKKAMEIQKKKAHDAHKATNYMGADATVYDEIDPSITTEFTGYDSLTASSKITVLTTETELVEALSDGEVGTIIVEKTPFYATMGGQQGDKGEIRTASGIFQVEETIKLRGGKVGHIGKMTNGMIKAGDVADLSVDAKLRRDTCRNHSATHLLQKALREVLGTHVEQAGSYQDGERTRFDFSHFAAMTPEELKKVEAIVNEKIAEKIDVRTDVMTVEEAKKTGARVLFGEKYGETVRVVSMGDFSKEFCGGTHVANTGDIVVFKIISESGVAAGVRRIEAVTGEQAEKVLYAAEDTMRNIAEYLNNPQVVQAVKKMLESNETLSKEVESMRREQVAQWADKIAASTPERHGMQLFATQTDRRPDFVKDLAYNLRQRSPRLVFVVGSVWDGKPTLTVMLGDEITACGVNAGAVVREAAKLMQGGGGGQAFFATAGGKNPDGLQAAIDKAVELIGAQVK